MVETLNQTNFVGLPWQQPPFNIRRSPNLPEVPATAEELMSNVVLPETGYIVYTDARHLNSTIFPADAITRDALHSINVFMLKRSDIGGRQVLAYWDTHGLAELETGVLLIPGSRDRRDQVLLMVGAGYFRGTWASTDNDYSALKSCIKRSNATLMSEPVRLSKATHGYWSSKGDESLHRLSFSIEGTGLVLKAWVSKEVLRMHPVVLLERLKRERQAISKELSRVGEHGVRTKQYPPRYFENSHRWSTEPIIDMYDTERAIVDVLRDPSKAILAWPPRDLEVKLARTRFPRL